MRRTQVILLLACAIGLASQARADLVSNLNDGDHVARATFDVVGNQLTIKLENLASSSSVPSDLLTGVWFNLPDPAILLGGTVKLLNDAYIINPGAANLDDGDGVELVGSDRFVSGEFGIETGGEVLALNSDANVVVANSGLGDLVGDDDRFAGQDLDNPESPDGMNYGIAPFGGLASDANTPLFNEPLIAGGVLITLDFTGSLSLDDITGIAFNYGTNPNFFSDGSGTDPNINPIPAPGAALLAAIGFGTVGFIKRRLN
jgi:hypothetical protein